MNKRQLLGLGALFAAASAAKAATDATPVRSTPLQPAPGEPLPKAWIDADTGHKVVRLSEQNHTESLYFNVPAYSSDEKYMVLQRTDGISLIDLATFAESNLIDGYSIMCTASNAPEVFAVRQGRPQAGQPVEYVAISIPEGKVRSLFKTDAFTKIVVNADGTLVAGTVEHGHFPPHPPGQNINLQARLDANIPMEIFTINVATGERKVLTTSERDWLNHLQFSPTDPNLLLYCHEGPWQEVDRVWTIRTDGTQKTQIHHRRLDMEIAGHEFFSWDGEWVLYDLQTPRGEDFWVSSYNLKTGQRIWYHLEDRNRWSVHYNISKDGKLLAGDGGRPEAVGRAPDGKWIWLFRPEIIEDLGVSAPNAADLVRPASTASEHLVNMSSHDYRLEPNVRFSPDGKWIFFRSVMHGPAHAYAVSVEKA